MADPRFDIRMSAYERNQRAKVQKEAAQQKSGYTHSEIMYFMNHHTQPKPRTNPIGIPLIRQSGRYYD